mgnify:FL=1
MNTLISVLMSVRNDEKNLKTSIESILKQTYTKFEFLIIDDFSDDGSLNIIKNYANEDNRIKVFTNKTNEGLTKSLNKLIHVSNGEFIARQDSDDISFTSRFEKQIRYAFENNLDVVGSRAVIKNSKKIIPGLSFYLPLKALIKFKNPFIHGSLLFKKEILEKVNYYDEKFYYAQDYKLMSDILKAKGNVKIMNNVLYELNVLDNISTIYYEQQKYYSNCVKRNITPSI